MRDLAKITMLALVLGCGADSTAPAEQEEEEQEVVRPSTTLDIQRAHGGGVRAQGRHVPWADVGLDYDVRGRTAGGFPGRMFAEALVSAGINERPIAKSWVYSDWSSEAGDYRVSTNVSWKGHFVGVGIAGAGATMTLVLKILDFRGNLVASEVLHEREVREAALTVAGFKDEGSKSAVLDFRLPSGTGGPFRIQFELTCESHSGLVGVDVMCLFGKTPAFVTLGLNGYAEWTKLSVTQFR